MSLFSLAPFLRGEGWGEELYPRAKCVESPPHPALRADLSPQAGRGERRAQRFAAAALYPGCSNGCDVLKAGIAKQRSAS